MVYAGPKIAATTITIKPVEGWSYLEDVTVGGPAVWGSARNALAWLAKANDLTPDTLGVHKTDFVITFADGHTYEGTFRLTYNDHDLAAHVIATATYTAKLARHHPTMNLNVAHYENFLDTYQIG